MNQMLTPEQIDKVHEVTDTFRLDRDAVVIPMVASDSPEELVLPDGKLLIRPPAGKAFRRWVAGLGDRLELLPLQRTRRND
ncbi:MAG: hypothetical protein QF645_05790 [Planctomycetota bacterium]|mgnify:CR=1 FL=1|jgi:hypothetical protein|nr:hypothetical protein [Planctomycetota bacterium]